MPTSIHRVSSPTETAPAAEWLGFYAHRREDPASPPTGRRSFRISQSWLFGWVLAALDGVFWIASFWVVSGFRLLLGFESQLPNASIYLLPLVVLWVVSLLIGAYDRRTDFLSLDFAAQYTLSLALGVLVGVFVVAVLGTYGLGTQPSRLMVPLTALVFLIPSLALRRLSGQRRQKVAAGRSYLVVGSGPEAEDVCQALGRTEHRASHVVLFDIAAASQTTPAEFHTLTRSAAVVVLACETDSLPRPLLRALVDTHFSDVSVLTTASFFESHLRRVYLPSLRPHWLFEGEFALAGRSVSHHVKRLFDVLVASVGLVLTAPVLLLVALAVRLESPGPVIFKQARVGRHRKQFTLYKFRTMRTGPEGSRYTAKNDARLTRLGRFLRKTRLDEVPQLWNVIKGDMSLIGPRAEWTACADDYENSIPNYHLRHLVRPGITGWAQVNYPYGASREDALEKLRYDLFYIKHFSLSLDWTIVLKTMHAMLFARGA